MTPCVPTPSHSTRDRRRPRINPPRAQRPSEENVLPLINIVFLLLIFFMIAGALSVTAPFELDPPAARATWSMIYATTAAGIAVYILLYAVPAAG